MRTSKSLSAHRTIVAGLVVMALGAGGAAYACTDGAGSSASSHCSAWEMARVWYGYTQSAESYPACGDLADHYDRHLLYPGTMLTTALTPYYRRDVVEVQLRLNDLYYSPVTIDGHYGQTTADAVRHFQAVHKLTLDGKVGGQTWHELFANLGQNRPTSD